MILLSVLLSLTKKTGMYFIAGTLVLFAIVYRKRWKPLTGVLASVLSVMLIALPLIVFPVLDVIPGGKQEALGPLFQQTARYAQEYPDDVLPWEREAIDSVLNYETLSNRYDALDADPVKFMWNSDAGAEEMLAYLKAYLSQGLRHPDAYFEAWFATAAGYLAPSNSIMLHEQTGSGVGDSDHLIQQPTQLDGVRSVVLGAYHTATSIPGVDVLFRIAPYSFWIPLLSFMLMVLRARRYVPMCIPTLMSLVCCLITPVVHARYALPLIYSAPLIAGLTFAACSSTNDKSNVQTDARRNFAEPVKAGSEVYCGVANAMVHEAHD